MNRRNAEVVISGLTAASNKRLSMYQKNLTMDRDLHVFDDVVRDYMLKVSTPRGRKVIEDTITFMDSIDWNQSKYEAAKIQEQVERFASPGAAYFGWSRCWKQAKSMMLEEVRSWKLKTLNYAGNDVIEKCLPRDDTHAGWSFVATGKRKKGEYREGLFTAYCEEVRQAKLKGSFNKPILIGSRTQAKPPYDPLTGERIPTTKEGANKLKKTRLVSMIDIYQILAELVFAKNFQGKLSSIPWYAGGKDDSQISTILGKLRRRFRTWISLDYSSYDQTISDWMIRDAFDIVRAAYQTDGWDEELFTIVREDFINKVFITGNGMVEAHKGVPSGSMFTQIIDSIVNRLMIHCYMASAGVTRYDMMIMGDDNIVFVDDLQPKAMLQSISTYLLRNFQIEMNPSKADYGDTWNMSPHFLSRYWTTFGVWRANSILIAKLCYPERFRDYKRKGFTPHMIVECYLEAFKLDFQHIIDLEKHNSEGLSEKKKQGIGKYLTGLIAYRKLYIDEAA